jgi:acetyltransferase-like isoleucine patch superfamily enzyme
MGARIGRNVTLSTLTNIKEFDLVSIGDGCILDACTISPFGLHAGAFELRPTAVGKRVIIGPKGIVAPGAFVPDDAYIGHGQSSHEVDFRCV